MNYDIIYGNSTLDLEKMELTYRGNWIDVGLELNQELVKSVVFDDDVTFVPDAIVSNPDYYEIGVFYFFKNLTSVRINSSCKVVGSGAFLKCESLTNVHMAPGSCVEIRENAFCYCLNLKSISISASCKLLGERAFSDCFNLDTVTFAKRSRSSSISFGPGLFEGCFSLTTVVDTPCLTSIPNNCFIGCVELTNFTVPETCVRLGMKAFLGTKLRTINIPKSCVEIGRECFCNCTHLEPFELRDTCTIVENETHWGWETPFEECRILHDTANKMGVSIIAMLRHKYRSRINFIYTSLAAMKICDARRLRNGGDDGITFINEQSGDEMKEMDEKEVKEDILVAMYRKLPTADLWREVMKFIM